MNTLEKFFYVSIGFVADITKRFEQSLEKLTKEGKLSELEAKDILENFKKSIERYSSEVRKKFDELIEKSLASFNLVKKSELEELEKRIEELKKRIEQL